MEAIIWGDTPRDLPEFSALIPAWDNTALSHLFPHLCPNLSVAPTARLEERLSPKC